MVKAVRALGSMAMGPKAVFLYSEFFAEGSSPDSHDMFCLAMVKSELPLVFVRVLVSSQGVFQMVRLKATLEHA